MRVLSKRRGSGTKTVREDRALIHYLLLVSERPGSMRLVAGIALFYVPEVEQVRFQSKVNKQGRSEEALPPEQAEAVVRRMEEIQRRLYQEYSEILNLGVARELARINLPLSSTGKSIFTISSTSYGRACSIRD